jgi:hypothetical protein
MFKRLAFGLALVIFISGIIFITLDILDIAEDYRLNLPIAIINTVVIGAAAVFIIFFSVKRFITDGSPQMLGLGGAALVFGVSIILYGWLMSAGLSGRITIYDSGVLLAAAMHTIGAGLVTAGRSYREPGNRVEIALSSNIGLIAIIIIFTWLAFHGTIDSARTITGELAVRDVIQGIAAILCVVSAFIYARIYRASRLDSYYWYSLGLILFAFGVLVISRGPLEGRTAWLGRLAQYVSGIYFLISAMSARRHPGGYGEGLGKT